jgi:N6-adenosine-specific RNA methylase IME4
MASIIERKNKKGANFYLAEGHRENGKVKVTFTPLGNKNPLPKGMASTNLPHYWIERLKRKVAQKPTEPPPNPTLPDGRWSVAYGDPPWRYDFDVESRATENHYPTLTLPELITYRDNKGVPIIEKFADNCILFLWATAPKLNEALELIKAWGFTYKTNLIWVKDKMGLGWYCRNQHELLLIAERGTMALPTPTNRPRSVISAPRTNHSTKPKSIYKVIEKAYPNYEYLELFGRGNKRKHWTAWGNGI